MAQLVQHFPVVVATTATKASPQQSRLALGDARVVERIEILIPPGPRGEVGFTLGSGGLPIIPDNTGAWLVTDNERLEFWMSDQITTGAWQLIAYNTGTYAHTLYVTFHLNESPASGGGLLAAVPSVVGTTVQPALR